MFGKHISSFQCIVPNINFVPKLGFPKNSPNRHFSFDIFFFILKTLVSCNHRWDHCICDIKPVIYATTCQYFRKSCRKFDIWWILVCLFIFCWSISNLFTHKITCSRCRIPSSRIFQIHGICQRILPHFAFMSFISSNFYRIKYKGNDPKISITIVKSYPRYAVYHIRHMIYLKMVQNCCDRDRVT